ncbi:MAG: secretin and TonB N-terminal domain-containing protein [Phycisphaerales bacterium]
MTVHSNKQTASSKNTTLTTASAAALGALAGSPAALAQSGDAFSLEKAPELISADTTQKGDQARVPIEGEIKVDEHLIVDLHVVDEDLADVLQLLSIQSQRNIVASKNVAANVTATLYGVTFYEALDAILHVNGFGYVEEGNFIYVYTAEEIKTLIESSRERTTAVIPLDYINSSDAAEFAQALLSENGQIKAPGKTSPFQIPDNAPVGADDLATEAFIVVVDFEENVDAIRDLLVQIDTKPSQVLVEATILQAALTENNAFGVDFSIIGNMNFGDFLGGPLNAVNNLIDGQGENVAGSPTALPSSNNGSANGAVSSVGRTAGPASLKVGYVDGDFAAFLRVLDEVTDTTIIARPKVLTLNRQPARVLVGERVGYLSSTTTQTGTTQTVEFLDTGTQLYFRPFVSRDGLIRMELKPQVSEAVIRDATDSGGAAVTIPDETTNELTANVMVRDGQTIVLGGLFRERTQYTRRQVPWIADLPFIGAPFRGREDSTDRAEIIFMITPTIVNDQIVSEHAERAKSLIDSAVAGTREGLLPFSRDKQASRLLVEAQQHAADGNTKKALYCVRRSLSLNPNQPQARLLLERLTTKTQDWPMQSILQSTFHTEMDLYLDEHGEMYVPTKVDMIDEGASLEGEIDTLVEAAESDTTDEDATDESTTEAGEGDTAVAQAETVTGTDAENASDTDVETGATIATASEGVNETTEELEPVDPLAAEAEAIAAADDSFEETELASARETIVAENAGEEAIESAESSESAFEGSDWINSLAQAEIGAAAGQTTDEPVEGQAETVSDDVETTTADETPAITYDSEARTFDVAVEDAPLPTFLRDLSSQARRSIIVSPDVAGTVSASLYGLTLEETLDAVLGQQNLGYVEEGKVIRVLPLDVIAQREAERKAEAAALAAAEQAAEEEAAAMAAADAAALEAARLAEAQGAEQVETLEPAPEAGTGEIVAESTDGTTANAPLTIATSEAEEAAEPTTEPAEAKTPEPVEFTPSFDASSPVEAEVEAQIEDQFETALLGSLSFNKFEWSPSVSRDGYTEPTSWDATKAPSTSSAPSGDKTDAGETDEGQLETDSADGVGSENTSQD